MEQYEKDAEQNFANWYDTNTTNWAAKFTEWLDNLKAQLEGDIATNLQKQIDEVKDMATTANENIALNKQTLGYSKKNLLKNTATTYTTNGVTYTVNNDGSVTANGTATADASINLSDFSLTNPSNSHVETLKSGNYILSGISGGSDVTYFIQYRDMTKSLSQNATDGDKEITVVNGNNVYVIIRVKAGITVNNLTFYPMIRSADIEDDTYEPYVDDVDTRIESLNTALNKAVSSSLNGSQFATLEEFVVATASDISHGYMFRFKDTGGWGPWETAGIWYHCVVQYQNSYKQSQYGVNGTITVLPSGSYKKMWTGYISGNYSTGVKVNWDLKHGALHTLNTLEEISANTKEEMIAGALALKELYEQSGGVQLGYTSDGKPGYYKAGADTVTPFSASGASITGISNVENSLSRMIYTYVTFDTSSHSSLTISGVNNVDSDSLGNSVFLTVAGETSSTSATLAEYTGTFSATLDVTNYDSVSIQIPATNPSLVSSEDGTIAEITSLKFE